MNKLDQERGTNGNRLFYLSTPPSQYPEIIQHLGAAGLNRNRKGGHVLLSRNPLGMTLPSARELNRQVGKSLQRRPNLSYRPLSGQRDSTAYPVFRLANGIFEPVWNRRYVDHVQITVAENLGMEGRSSHYEEARAIRDMV